MQHALIPQEKIVQRIYLIRGRKVMLDRDLAELYGVETKVLNQTVRRNRDRFPEDFMFQLEAQEFENLKSQIVTSSWGGTRKLPLAFTEQGVVMLSSVLRSKQAIQINILIIKAFVRMRELLETNEVLRTKLALIEQQLGSHSKAIREIYKLIQRLLTEPEKPKREIGFQRGGK
jgi:phage regulator Rha-like protein